MKAGPGVTKYNASKKTFREKGGRIGVCKSTDPCLFFAKSVDPPKFLFKSETITTSENRSVKVQNETGTQCAYYLVNFAQIVKKTTFLMTITQYSSNNLTVSHLSLNELLLKKK